MDAVVLIVGCSVRRDISSALPDSVGGERAIVRVGHRPCNRIGGRLKCSQLPGDEGRTRVFAVFASRRA